MSQLGVRRAGVVATVCTQGKRTQHGKPDSVVGHGNQPEAGDRQRGSYGVAQRPVILRKSGNAGGGKEPWFRTGAATNNASEIRATLVNSINVREMQKVSHTEAKEEPGLRAGKPVTARVVALPVRCITLDRCTSGYTFLCDGRV